MEIKYVYSFGEGSKDMKFLLGGKGVNLVEMIKIGLFVFFGFIIIIEVCNDYYVNNESIRVEIIKEIEEYLVILEKDLNKILGCNKNLLLVLVCFGVVFFMLGMMDIIFNLGFNDNSVVGLVEVI